METVIMPKELTAENGAKALLMGEFKEPIEMQCSLCDGDGVYNDDDDEVCEECGGSGCYTLNVPISWTTIKEIYRMAVANLTSNPPLESDGANASGSELIHPHCIYECKQTGCRNYPPRCSV